MSNANLLEDFRWRGIVSQASQGLEDLTAKEQLTGYIGFDPSASSLHVGSLLPVMALARFQRFGHCPIAVVGGGTGLIGDPSGKSAERPMLSLVEIEQNLQGLKSQLEPFLNFDAGKNPARVINNADWLGRASLLDFLRDTGKHFTVNYMLGKESVKRRLAQEEGISYTEFSYMLLQAYDFLELHDRFGCKLQMGGSDQWGNITAGMDLIGKLRRVQAHGLVFPLVTTSAGKKFGKTEAGTIWLDAKLTSPYHFYQFWFNADDRDVIPYVKFFTWLSRPEVEELEAAVRNTPEKRAAQIRLARELTKMLHGATALDRAEKAARALFSEEIDSLSEAELLDVLQEAPRATLAKDKLAGDGLSILDLCIAGGLAASKGEARRLISGGGVYLNNRRVTDEKHLVTAASSLHARFLVLRRGPKEFRLLELA